MNKLLDYFEGRVRYPCDTWRYHFFYLVDRWDRLSSGHNLTQLTSSIWDWTPIMVRMWSKWEDRRHL